MSNSVQLHRRQPTRLLCPWDSPGKNTGVGCHFLLQGIFLTQETNLGLLHCRHILYWLHYEGKPNILNNSHLRSVVGSQETPGVTGKFGLGIRNEAGQRQIEFCQENALVITNTREDSIHGHHQMVNTEIRLIIFFAAKDGEALYSQQNKTRS